MNGKRNGPRAAPVEPAPTILVVDDEPANVKLLSKTLVMAGYQQIVPTTESGEVMDLCRRHQVDLVLLDLAMPGLDGFDILELLRVEGGAHPVPVLVLTAQADRVSRIRALQAGARDFVTKPFDAVELVSRVNNLVEVRQYHKSLAEQNRLLEEQVRQRTRELHDTRLEIIRRLGRAAEYRDNETGLHIIRMSNYSQLLGRAAGLSEAQAEMLLQASPMHDLGKIGIPDEILLKPGRLDPDEWLVMKTHAAIGARILAGHESELLKMAAQIALSHHEKWDGSGYPEGLRGEEIPLVARAVAVADVFDALTSERPYKKAWPDEKAIDEIRRCVGSHFDPALGRCFEEVLPQMLEIKQRYAEPTWGAATSMGGTPK